MSTNISKLLLKNQTWAKSVNPEILKKCGEGQWPGVLFIGCSDSRCSDATILGSELGEVFTHRNIANQFNNKDTSGKAVVDYAIKHLEVKEVALCGHTGCGGMAASKGVLDGQLPDPSSPITEWLNPFISHCKELKKDLSLDELIVENISYNKNNLINYINDDSIQVKGLVW